jgi:NAD(P)H-hydrate epimerase
MRELITPRAADSHKGDYGRVLIVAGSRGKTGRAHLSAIGALRSGAGLVTIATPASCQPVIAAMAPEYMTEALTETADGLDADGVDRVLEMARDVVAIGPGLGARRRTREFVRQLVDRATMPLVIDADGLNAFAEDPDRLAGREGRDVIITPHPGRWRAWSGCRPTKCSRAGSRSRATSRGAPRVRRAEGPPDADRDAGREGLHQPDRQPGMATGGTGDVLTG